MSIKTVARYENSVKTISDTAVLLSSLTKTIPATKPATIH